MSTRTVTEHALRRWSPPAALARASVLVLSLLAPAAGGACTFRAPGGWDLAFATLVPGSDETVRRVAMPRSQDAGIDGCAPGITLRVNVHSSENGLGHQLRLRHARGEAYIPYSLSFPSMPASAGPSGHVPLRIVGEIRGTAYRNAPAGAYSDTVVLQVTP